jgi:hypothetical protein
MAIILGTYTFDESRTSVVEKHEEVGGKDSRLIILKGIIEGASSQEVLEAELDAILAAASEDQEELHLALRPGRHLMVRRVAFSREIATTHLVASFELTLEAQNPWELADAEAQTLWAVTASGDTQDITTTGNTHAFPEIRLAAAGSILYPTFSDGLHSLTYEGLVADGETLVFDGPNARATLDGIDVTPYISGTFPRVMPGGSTLTYTDDAASSHTAAATIFTRDRWW